jgi:hypothetical protein
MIKQIFTSALFLFAFASPAHVYADWSSIKTSAGNAYYAGGDLNISENISGDIFAIGGNLSISGNTEDDLIAAAGRLSLSGNIGGDARVAGGKVTINSEVGGEMMIAGGEVSILPGTSIKKDLFLASGKVNMAGEVKNDLKTAGGEIMINGAVRGNVIAKTGKLTIGKNAVIYGDLSYESPEEARIEEGAVIKGATVFKLKEQIPSKERALWLVLAWWILKVLATMAAAFAIYFTFRDRTEKFAALALNRFGRELLTGFIILVVIPAAVVILFISALGYLLGLVGLFFYIAFIILSTILGAVVFSGLTGKYIFKKEPYITWPILLFGITVYHAVGLIPVVGWIFRFLFFLAGLGTLSELSYRALKEPVNRPV